MNKDFEVLNGGLTDLQKDERDILKGLPNLQWDERDVLIQQLLHQSIREMQSKVEQIAIEQNNIKEEVSLVKKDLNNKVTLDHGQQQALNNAKRKTVEVLWANNEINKTIHDTKRKLHGAAGKALNDAFGVSSYRDIKEKDFDKAINFIKSWRPRIV